MARKGRSTEEIIAALREAEVRIGQGETVGKICRSLGISEQTYYKWRREYGGLKLDQAKRLKELERENERLRKAVSELTLDKLTFPYRSGVRVRSSDSRGPRNVERRRCAMTRQR